MGHTHGDAAPEHSHGGSAPGLAWHVLDVLMLVCAVIVLGLWAEVLVKAYRQHRAERVRYSLTPEGEAAARPTVDEGALAAELARLDQEDAARRDAAAVLGEVSEVPTGTEWLRRKASGSK